MATRTGPAVLQVHIFRDGDFLGTDVFNERQIIIGRDPDEADLVLESSQVSRKHAIIENDNGKLSVRDAGSTNGVYVNADKIEGTVEVTRLDEIRIGEFSLKLKITGKGKGDPAAKAEDSTGQMAAVMPSQPSGSVSRAELRAEASEPSRTEARPAKVDIPTERRESIQPSARSEDRTREEQSYAGREEEPRHAAAMRARSNPDLSEFDDTDEPTSAGFRTPSAEFRRREHPVDRDKLGDMLAGIGIEGSSATAAHGVAAPTRIDRAYQRPVDLAAELEGPEPTPATRVDISALDDEGSVTRSEVHVRSNGHSRAAPIPRGEVEAESLTHAGPGLATGLPRPPDVLGFDSDPMSAMEPHAELTHDDDDHDDEEDFEPQYSLVDHILAEELPPKNGVPRVEVLGMRDDIVESVTMLAPGDSFWVGPPTALAKIMAKVGAGDGGAYVAGPRYELVKHGKPGQVEVEFKKDSRGLLQRGGRTIDLAAAGAKANKKHERRGTQMMGLARGEVAQVTDGAVTYHIRHVIAPAPLRDSRPFIVRMRPEKLLLISAGAALLGHICAMLFFSLVAGHVPSEKEHAKEEFIEVTIEPEMKLEEPPPPPPEPEPTPPAPPEPVQEQKPIPQKQPKNVKLPKVASTPPPPNPAPAGVLGLLNKTGATQAPGPAAAVAAISNLAAAKTPSGSSGYKVSGLIGKLPTSDLAIGGGGGGPMTKGAAALLRGGGGGAGAITGKVGGKVGGLVTKMPGQMHAAGGSLDRDEIQKVVNKHVGEIQRCYERELLKTPGLSGKVTIEWVVATSGAVKSSRQKDSTMQSSAAVNCMLSSVKGWQFPQPKGGEVVVSYPFNFSPIGM